MNKQYSGLRNFPLWGVLIMLGLLGSGCATTPVVRVGEGMLSWDLQNEETKILDQVHREVDLIEQKGALYTDPDLEAYLQQVGQRMVPSGRTAVGLTYRFRIIRDPALNAFAYPTGDIFVHTGLLARLRSEGEVADVLGHEASHVYSRDTLYKFMDARRKTITWKVTDLVLTPALTFIGAGGLAEMGLGLVYATSVTGYGRNLEARSDIDGLQQLVVAGYDPSEGIRAQERFLAEEEKYRQGPEIFFLSSHPNTRWRIEAKKKWLREKGIPFAPSAEKEDVRHMAATARVRRENARLNLQMGRYHHALDDLEPISRGGRSDPETLSLVGEAYRRMAEDPKAVEVELNEKAWREIAVLNEKGRKDQWRQKAQETYNQALALDPRFPETHRGLGLLFASESKFSQARQHFEEYLRLDPQAKDRRYILSQLDRLTKEEQKEVKSSR